MLNDYLTSISKMLLLSKEDKDAIKISYDYLKAKIENELAEDIQKIEPFGSYIRDTFIPVKYSEKGDIDLMIIFEENKLKPQTLLTKLKESVKDNYSRSVVYQDHPTIALVLDHIKFELVPTRIEWFFFGGDTLMIPLKNGEEHTWQKTFPDDLLKKLDSKDERHNGMLKPLIRLLKYYNANSGYPFSSFHIEECVVGLNYYSCKTNLDYLFYFIKENELSSSSIDQTMEKKKLKNIKENIEVLNNRGLPEYSLMELHKIFPPIII